MRLHILRIRTRSTVGQEPRSLTLPCELSTPLKLGNPSLCGGKYNPCEASTLSSLGTAARTACLILGITGQISIIRTRRLEDVKIPFPIVPDATTMVHRNHSVLPLFFGCDASLTTTNDTSSPIVLYLVNAPYSAYTNFSYVQSSTTREQMHEQLLSLVLTLSRKGMELSVVSGPSAWAVL